MTDDLNTVKLNMRDTPAKRYHHGDLRDALIAAGEEVLRERGVAGFSLREAARRAGVSPAAPAHHFGDARGLLTAIATLGFNGLSQGLIAANAAAGDDRRARILAQGHAYVRYALTQPARFDLMWQRDLLNGDDPDFQAAGFHAFSLLHELVTGEPLTMADMQDDKYRIDPRVIATWSVVHGFAGLARQGAFDPETPGLLDGVLSSLQI